VHLIATGPGPDPAVRLKHEKYWRMFQRGLHHFASLSTDFDEAKSGQDFMDIPFALESLFLGQREVLDYFLHDEFAVDWCARNNVEITGKCKKVTFPKAITTSREMFGLVASLVPNVQPEVEPLIQELPVPEAFPAAIPEEERRVVPAYIDWRLVEELVNSCTRNWKNPEQPPPKWIEGMKRHDNLAFVAGAMIKTKTRQLKGMNRKVSKGAK
jgi:hypothetical protein